MIPDDFTQIGPNHYVDSKGDYWYESTHDDSGKLGCSGCQRQQLGVTPTDATTVGLIALVTISIAAIGFTLYSFSTKSQLKGRRSR